MNRILVIGGGGMLGQKLAHRIAAEKTFGVNAQVSLFDLAFPPNSAVGNQIEGSLTAPGIAKSFAAQRPDVIFHLAAIVSGQAETDFALGWGVNLMATWALLNALKDEHEVSKGEYRPRLVFASSIAVFGAPFPDKINDEFLSAPLTSYGAQKAASEIMITDFSRKGFINGISLRLPTLCVRPGKANAAASSFFSGIIREPLNGEEAILPVADTVRHWHASPRAAAAFLTHAANLDTELLNDRRSLNMPGVSCTVSEQIEALRTVAGQDAVALIKRTPDAAIESIVKNWPRDFETDRALDLGFRAESSFDDIVRVYLEDDYKR
ncbi:NAD-dependent epimerase/dehydratase family protein [Ruegeria sp. AD91A]|uniref:D-erythronate dehydrogenase n=1 Tax=Ruegeria sp. AD91A TaxID=2293862 RepID=UPI000E554821|nr:D-erythronate dehydrogenase [Ruegeria sp. AD91A]AXT26262.1 NAD-dependent epimerase/dehydratase family protein [Ruegeria sp. AD91A]